MVASVADVAAVVVSAIVVFNESEKDRFNLNSWIQGVLRHSQEHKQILITKTLWLMIKIEYII